MTTSERLNKLNRAAAKMMSAERFTLNPKTNSETMVNTEFYYYSLGECIQNLVDKIDRMETTLDNVTRERDALRDYMGSPPCWCCAYRDELQTPDGHCELCIGRDLSRAGGIWHWEYAGIPEELNQDMS